MIILFSIPCYCLNYILYYIYSIDNGIFMVKFLFFPILVEQKKPCSNEENEKESEKIDLVIIIENEFLK